MSRYNDTTIIQNQTSPRYLSSTRYPDIPLYEDDVYIITQFGDRLDNLANQFYSDSTLWWVLSVANPDLPNDSLYPPLAYQLRIPSFINDILNDFKNINQ
jgi:hypothetical protein